MATTAASAPKVPNGASFITQPTIRKMTTCRALTKSTMGLPLEPDMFRANPKMMEMNRAGRIAPEVKADNRVSGISPDTKCTNPVSVFCPGILEGSRVLGSMFIPSPGLKMFATASPMIIDSSENAMK